MRPKRNDKWSVIGPGGGGAQFHPEISPHDANVMLVSSDMTGAYISENGGGTWRMFNLRGVPRFFAFDPVDAKVMYAKTLALWRSRDGGRMWELVHPDASNVEKVVIVDDHAQERIVTRDGSQETVTALAVDPDDSRILYAGISEGDDSWVSISADWGKTWKNAGGIAGAASKIFVEPDSPKGNRTLYVITASAVSLFEDGKWTHHPSPEGVKIFNGVSAGFGAAGPLIYGVSGQAWRADDDSARGIFVSRDRGATWERCDGDVAGALGEEESVIQFQAVAACRARGEIAYVSYKVPGDDPIVATRVMGALKTTNGGQTWDIVWCDMEKVGENVKGAWLEERFGPWWGENPFDMAVAAGNADVCIGTDFGRTMRTQDGGRTWEGVYSNAVEGGEWTTTGLDVTCCYSLHFDPFDQSHVFISYTDTGLEESRDGGSSWSSATRHGVPRQWLNSTYWVEFDPKVEGKVWAVMSADHDLPRPKMWRSRSIDTYDGGVLVSSDGGTTWEVTSEGMKTAATHVLVDPTSPAGNRTLWVCGFGKGVFKSTDDGKTWAPRNKGIEGKEPLAWRITRSAKGELYLVVIRRALGDETGPDKGGAIYRSLDGAESWEKLPLPAGCNGPTSLALDAKDERRIVISAWGRENKTAGDEGGGVYVSSDGGVTWSNTLTRDQHVHDVTVDERNNIYYACGFEGKAWRSDDAGETWKRMKGYNFKWGRRVVPDPKDADKVYITTFGGSVWHGPAAGDQEAREDIATPVMKLAE